MGYPGWQAHDLDEQNENRKRGVQPTNLRQRILHFQLKHYKHLSE
jgi:hypothetical protein